MQKKIIALAVAGLVSGAAFAQSNVTVYGIVDMAYVYNGSHVDSGVDSYSALDDGGWDSSRLGFKGTEDLGNGLSANFMQEYGTHLDYLADGMEIRKSYVSLAGKSWGEVKLGAVGSVHDDYAGWSESGGMAWGNGVVGLLVTGDAYNAVEYVSPSFSGLQFKVGASSNYTNGQDVGGELSPENLRAVFGSVAYANGGLKVAMTYDNVNAQNSDFKKDEFMVVAGYDFGMVKVGAGYDRASADNWDNVYGKVTRDAYRLTVGAPIGASGAVALSYTNASTDVSGAADDNDADAWGISYSHFLSKRTALYASAYIGDFEDGALVDTGDGQIPTITGYETGVKFGVRHTF